MAIDSIARSMAISALAGGGGGGILRVSSVYDEETSRVVLDKTWQEIHDAYFAFIVADTGEWENIAMIDSGESTYTIKTVSVNSGSPLTYSCDTPSAYPYYED